MISIHYYLDTRRAGEEYPLKLIVSKRMRNGMLSTGISLPADSWDARAQKVVRHPRAKVLNAHLARLKTQAEDFINPLLYAGKLADMTAPEIKALLDEHLNGKRGEDLTLARIVEDYITHGNKASAQFRRNAWARVVKVDPSASTMPARKVTPGWARTVAQKIMDAGYNNNTMVYTFSVLRAAWNAAGEKVSGTPLKGIATKTTMTAKRDLTADQLRRLWYAPTETDREAEALAFFKCSFLMRAANPIDILSMKPEDIKNGRIYYKRSKTGKDYSVKVEPELAELLRGRSSRTRLWYCRSEYRSYLTMVNASLKPIAKREGLPPVSAYWARHTLASLMFNSGTPIEVVSSTLGHALPGARVTSTYIDVNLARVDKAFRDLLDSLFPAEGKKVVLEGHSDVGSRADLRAGGEG